MTKNVIYPSVFEKIHSKEVEFNLIDSNAIEKSFEMIQFLKLLLVNLKQEVLQTGFENQVHEIEFFKVIKPHVVSKLIFYNKVYLLETNCPIDTAFKNKYYRKYLEQLNLEYKKHFSQDVFYRYFNANRIDKDIEYFTLGKTDLIIGLNSFIFEVDPLFSTYYDYKASRIIAHGLLQSHLRDKVQQYSAMLTNKAPLAPALIWSESQSALIELIYALYLSGSINNGKGEIRKIASLFQQLFGVNLLDIHHAFHRMKTRAKSKTSYIDKLRQALENHMDNGFK